MVYLTPLFQRSGLHLGVHGNGNMMAGGVGAVGLKRHDLGEWAGLA
jgi:hypothetical protein